VEKEGGGAGWTDWAAWRKTEENKKKRKYDAYLNIEEQTT
jgi:hypothetical protein